MLVPATQPVIDMRKVCMAFAKASGEPLPVLADIDVTMPEGEILGLLGRSGSGKSKLLRIAAGLIKPTSGEVRYRGKPLVEPAEGIAMVFQTFALYPWLTVLENVELGLDALHLSLGEARRRVMSAIDLIGLDGFQSAYPASYRAACVSGSGLRGRSSATLSCFSRTSRFRRSMSSRPKPCAPIFLICGLNTSSPPKPC
jgi:ABC-type nitrate/sulfonate/bicarbonate transport system ATPase subunit